MFPIEYSDGVDFQRVDEPLDFDPEFEKIKRIALAMLTSRGHRVKLEHLAISKSDMESLIGVSEFKPVAPRSVLRLIRLGLVKGVTGGAYTPTSIGEELIKCYREVLQLYKAVARKRMKRSKELRKTRWGRRDSAWRNLNKENDPQ